MKKDNGVIRQKWILAEQLSCEDEPSGLTRKQKRTLVRRRMENFEPMDELELAAQLSKKLLRLYLFLFLGSSNHKPLSSS